VWFEAVTSRAHAQQLAEVLAQQYGHHFDVIARVVLRQGGRKGWLVYDVVAPPLTQVARKEAP
jgi:hypothetical protein